MMRFSNEATEKGLDDRYFANHPMMQWGSNSGSLFWVHIVLALITWTLVIIVLVALARWLWKKGDKVK